MLQIPPPTYPLYSTLMYKLCTILCFQWPTLLHLHLHSNRYLSPTELPLLRTSSTARPVRYCILLPVGIAPLSTSSSFFVCLLYLLLLCFRILLLRASHWLNTPFPWANPHNHFHSLNSLRYRCFKLTIFLGLCLFIRHCTRLDCVLAMPCQITIVIRDVHGPHTLYLQVTSSSSFPPPPPLPYRMCMWRSSVPRMMIPPSPRTLVTMVTVLGEEASTDPFWTTTTPPTSSIKSPSLQIGEEYPSKSQQDVDQAVKSNGQ